MSLHRPAAAFMIVMLVACAEHSLVQEATGPDLNGITARAVRSADTQARANLVWADSVDIAAPGSTTPTWQPAGIRGDGRDRSGQPSTFSEYQGNFCGVSAFLSKDGAASLNSDSDVDYTSGMSSTCGASRLERFYYDGAMTPTFAFGPHFWVLNLAYLAVGQSATQEIFFGIQQSNCQRLYYGDTYSPSNNARITRLPDVVTGSGTVRQWRVDSQGSHRAMCVNVSSRGGKLISTGVSHFTPFAYTVTEVPYPYPTYP